VYAVWEPMLVSDVGLPGRWALSTLSDRRVEQFWDPSHLVSQKLKSEARPPQAEPDCCERQGNLWDLAAVYPAGATWADRLPPAIVFNGPIVDVTPAIETAITAR
jgi:hypothetical protein